MNTEELLKKFKTDLENKLYQDVMIMRRIQLYKEEIAEIKQLFIKAGLNIDDIHLYISQEGEPIEYQVMAITVSGYKDIMEKFKYKQLKEFKEQHQTDIGVEYICGSINKDKYKNTYEFWKYY